MAAGGPVRTLLVDIVGPEQQQPKEMMFTLTRQHINKPTMTTHICNLTLSLTSSYPKLLYQSLLISSVM